MSSSAYSANCLGLWRQRLGLAREGGEARVARILPLVALVLAGLGAPGQALGRKAPRCPSGMVEVRASTQKFCVDRYENTVEQRIGKRWGAHPPSEPVTGKTIRAVSKRGVLPQAYISGKEAAAACAASSKRLCSAVEWRTACQGKNVSLYPYGSSYRAGRCNDQGISGFDRIFQQTGHPSDDIYSFESMNDPRINRVRGTVARTGSFSRCKNALGIHDMVGNVAEWVDDASGTFLGGFYLSHTGPGSSAKRGEGCNDGVIGHSVDYHDYSTGFRCCALPR